MLASGYANLSRTPKPRATVECGSYSNPNYGCTDEREDAIAAYSDALAWYITRDARRLGDPHPWGQPRVKLQRGPAR